MATMPTARGFPSGDAPSSGPRMRSKSRVPPFANCTQVAGPRRSGSGGSTCETYLIGQRELVSCYRTPAAGFCCYGLGVVTRTVLRIAKAAGVKLTRGRPCRNRPPCWAPRASLTSSPVGSSDPGPAHRRHPPDLPPPVRLRRDVCKMRRAGFGWDQRCLHRREHYPRRSPPTAGNQANRGIRQDTLANTGWRSNSPGALRLRPCAG